MSALEVVQAAIDKLTKLKAESFPGEWEALTSGVEHGDHWYVQANREAILSVSANDGSDEAFRESTARLIVTLHRTIDAQLEILTMAVDMGVVAGGEGSAALTLAHAINGVSL